MNVTKFAISAIITVGLIIFLNNGWIIKGTPLPPLGKFLDPYHGFWQNIEKTDYKPGKQINFEGLQQPVTIVFDTLMIPHIFAKNDADLYKAQGYVTAMHRLWQMELQTHNAAGRLTEIMGNEVILNIDRTNRRLGMGYGANHVLEYMQENDTVRTMIESYTNGINAYINSLDYEHLPFEYKLLDYRPEQWTSLKCAQLLMNMAKTLNIFDKDIEMTNALKLFGKANVDLLYPDDEKVGDPIVDNTGKWNFPPLAPDTVPLAVPEELISMKRLTERDPTVGSNNWAVAGTKTATGSPILCNDPHLGLSLPSLWYVVQLNAPGINAMGASLPGAPGIIIGYNDSIAWGMTNAQRDLVDWFKITYKDTLRNEYKYGDGWAKTEKVVEEFKIKGGSTFYDTVIYTKWGPVTYDQRFRAENNHRDYAFRWIAHDKSQEIMTFYKLNRAKNHAGYMKALNHFSSPAQNFVFASVSGDIAIRIQGKFPVRRPNEGRFVLDGSNPLHGWRTFIPSYQNATQKNPERGFVSSANQYPTDSTYPYYITATSFEAYRNRRINEILTKKTGNTVDDMMALQSDNYNLKAAESVPVFLSYLDSTRFTADERVAFDKLKKWDFFNDKDSEAASYYEAWWDALVPIVWDEMESETVTLDIPTAYTTIKLIREQPDLVFFDRVKTESKETAREVVQQSFSNGVANIKKWMENAELRKSEGGLYDGPPTGPAWGRFKGSYIGHLLPTLRPLSIPVNTGGNHDIVNAHSRTKGPSWRMIVSLEKSGVKGFGTYPGGQSGNPGSPHYSKLLDRWVEGKTFPLTFMKEPGQAGSYCTTTLNPE
jgi:penicillin G amidase